MSEVAKRSCCDERVGHPAPASGLDVLGDHLDLREERVDHRVDELVAPPASVLEAFESSVEGSLVATRLPRDPRCPRTAVQEVGDLAVEEVVQLVEEELLPAAIPLITKLRRKLSELATEAMYVRIHRPTRAIEVTPMATSSKRNHTLC